MGERDKNPIKSWLNPEIKRRTFLQVSSTLALASAGVVGSFIKPGKAQAQPYGENPPDTTDGLCVLRSACQMCHSRCGIQATLKDGVLIKIDGNPYHPNNMSPDERLNYGTDTTTADTTRGRLCLKGQSGIQTVYDPYRIKQPLKRVGSRGSGQWEAISWPQAFSEIATQINTLIPQGTRYSDMDPLNTKKGKNTNLLGFSPGRTVEAEMSERIWKYGWGTANYALGHTSICESSRHVANELITWEYKTSGGKNSMGAGRSSGWQPDILGAEYIIYFGSNPLEAGFPMLGMARNLMEFKKNGKYVVVDPRFSNSAAQAHQWVPIKPGGDSAMAMGMARWIIENNRYDKIYLENTNPTSAGLDNETTYTDSTYLVRLDNKPYAYLKASDIGIGGNENVVWSGGEAKKYDAVPHGELDVEVTVKGIKCKTGFRLFKEEALTRSISQYAAIAGVDTTLITGLANELTNHGKKAVVGHYRGPCKHTNGLYAVLAIQHLNTLIGNYDWKGGCTPGAGGWGHTSGVVTLSSVSGAPGYGGVGIARCKKFYDPSEIGDLFKGYPAPRQWFPFGTHGNYQEVIPSIVQGYPYDMKVMITYWNAWPYATPALRKVFKDALVNNKIELFVAITPVYGEVAEFADYILPDTTYLEKFGVPGIPWRVEKGTSFQRPVVGKFDGREIGDHNNCSAIEIGQPNNYTPVLPDTKAVLDIHIGLAKALGYDGTVVFPVIEKSIKAVGADALGAGENLYNSWDWAYAILRNIQFSSGFTVDTILQKGGVFRDPGDEYTGDKL
ncbi:MAG: molybdopterin-dependent oxidoreductase, partial [Nitrospinae bacterium]|nr:molybdopterin-dependent oxidoreductase [Nitrospinota bacterium]